MESDLILTRKKSYFIENITFYKLLKIVNKERSLSIFMNIPEKEVTPLEKEVFLKMTQCNPGVTIEDISESYSYNYFQYFVDDIFADKKRKPLIDISPLACLQNLKEITFFNCKITDISPLSELVNLIDIKIYNNRSEILPCDFTNLKNLQSIYINGVKTSAPKVGGLQKLSSFFIRGCNDLSPLSGAISLKTLDISENPDLTDLSPIADCISLEKISAYKTSISDISPLKDLIHLQELSLIGTKVRDVSPLKDLVQLCKLDLRCTKVEDISPLKNLIHLNYIDIHDTLITDISAFKERKNIIYAKRTQLGSKVKKSPAEMKKAIEQIKEKIEELGIKPRPTLQYEQIEEFEQGAKIKLPKEYTLFLTEIGDGFETELYIETIIPFSEANFNPEDIAKKFNFQNLWVWEGDERPDSRYHSIGNGQLHLMNNGCGYYYNLIVCGRAKGEVWEMTDVGMGPYKYGADFLDWIWDFLNDKLIMG